MLRQDGAISKIRFSSSVSRQRIWPLCLRARFSSFPLPDSVLKSNDKINQGRQPRKGQISKEEQLRRKYEIYNIPPPETSFIPKSLRQTPPNVRDVRERTFLNNRVETHIYKEAPTRFGLDTTKPITGFKDTAPNAFFPFMPAHISKDKSDPTAVGLLWPVLNSVLPPDPLNPTFYAARGSWWLNSWAPTEVNARYPDNNLPLGWHLPMYPTVLEPTSILPDGTDSRFLPGPATTWPYRLWVSGSIRLCLTQPHVMRFPTVLHHILERPIALAPSGTDEPTGASVTVRKTIHKLMGKQLGPKYSEEGALNLLGKAPSQSSDDHLGPHLAEDYTLRFFREKPTNLASNSRVVQPHDAAKLKHTLTLNRHHLFAWSAATQNAHLIHIDSTYARDVYGARDLLIHGPFMLFLVLEWLRRALTQMAVNRLDKFVLISIDYKNLLPIFVDEPMTFCAKPTQKATAGGVATEWRVWIEKTADDGRATMAFTSLVKLRTEKWDGVQPRPLSLSNTHRDKSREVADDDGQEEDGFTSPFFDGKIIKSSEN